MDGAPQGETPTRSERTTPTRSEGRTRARSEGEARIRSGWAYSAGQGGDQAFRSATITAFVIIAATVFAMSILHGRPELLLVRVVETGCLMVGGAACVWAGMRERGAERAWRLLVGAMVLSLGVASGAIGRDIVFNHSGPIPRLTPATMLYLIPAGAGFAGLLCMPSEPYDLALHGRCDGRDRRWLLITMLDSLIVVGAVALLLWILVLQSVVLAPAASPSLPYLVVSPLVAGLLSVIVVLTAAFRRPRSPHSLAMLGIGIMVFSFSSSAYAYAEARGRTDVPRIIDLGFAVAALIIMLAALLRPAAARAGAEDGNRPSLGARADGDGARGRGGRLPVGREPADRARDAEPVAEFWSRPRRRWWHAVLPYLPLIVAGTGTLLQSDRGDLGQREEIWVLLALLVLALVRQMITMVDNVRLLARVEEKQRQLHHQAFHDPLTGLANRALFADRLTRALAARECRPRRLAVLFCDLDDFKDVNDGLGHAAGDELLKITAARLSAQDRAADTVARFGGDEFAILLESDGEDPEAVGRRLAEAVRAPVRLARTTYTIAVSVGLVAVGTDTGPTSAEALLHCADLAMYRAKNARKKDLTVHGPEVYGPQDFGPEQPDAAAARPVSRAALTAIRCDGPDRPESARPSAPGRLGAPPHVSPLGRSPPPGVRGPEEPPPDPSNRDTVVGGPTLPGDLDHMSNHDPRAVSGI
ncbi:diguanylate cyclase domain-containing protein [Parafrankia sp. BMG5.11]|uniref:diguanylate cyclase domain-containing protein n=1 Tax=Parafrankia sp. BMG5.11 TaxID=222540 RepID=UPI001FB42089|nr:diguanylate cyclase [Parafrankia sp. BMG5.11]